MKNMIYSKHDKQIVFDDYVDNTAEYKSYYVEMCSHCCNKYKDILGNRVDDGGVVGGVICSVKECANEVDCYVDFDMNEVEFI